MIGLCGVSFMYLVGSIQRQGDDVWKDAQTICSQVMEVYHQGDSLLVPTLDHRDLKMQFEGQARGRVVRMEYIFSEIH